MTARNNTGYVLSICIEDFCGSYPRPGWPAQWWADWFPDDNYVYFGGDWHAIPPMPAKSLPSRDDVYAWVDRHSPRVIPDE